MQILRKIVVLATISASLIVAGCSDFERKTFQTLSYSRDTLNAAQDEYERVGTPEKPKKIPHNKCAFTLITDGKAAQVNAEQAMMTYEELKVKGGDLTAQAGVVTSAVVGLAPLVVKVKTLYVNPATACGGA